MQERTQPQPQQPTPSPWVPAPGRILSEPGTVAQCRADYEQGAGVRHRMDQQDALVRR